MYITPEKLISWRSQLHELAKAHHLACIAVDEAHCVSEWVSVWFCALLELSAGGECVWGE